MNTRQKFIASCSNPYYENFATREEVKEAKQLAKGKYWHESGDAHYCSFSPGGIRRFFAYDGTFHNNSELQNNVYGFLNKLRQSKAKRCAKLWSIGFCKEAKLLENLE